MSEKMPVLGIILPCYNEEAVLPITIPKITALLSKMSEEGEISPDSFALFVDDGSTDATWKIIECANKQSKFVKGLKFWGNSGHQNAIVAGMLEVTEKVDCVITIDADLQDDINVIPEMIEKFKAGYMIVYGVRRDRATDSWFKRTTANLFYKIMKLLGANSISGHADFRLVGRPALEYLREYKESELFLRTLFPAMKFPAAEVFYSRLPRAAGVTKYPFSKMLSFAMKGITMSSPTPLRLSGILGIITLIIAIIQSILAIKAYLAGDVIRGWTSLILIVLYIGSIQLFSLAIIGEYLAKIFIEVKHRPRYSAEKKLL